jgi:hypothetical protein
MRLVEREAVNPGGGGLFSPHQEEADQQKRGEDVSGGCNAARHLLGRRAFGGGAIINVTFSLQEREPQAQSGEPDYSCRIYGALSPRQWPTQG